ncbi:LysE family translocator [Aestuariirhabdus litorea]|uniref:LysE family translocator n=1 Tax=Aestuariirhabdus litorea TaxID=2528527 RepID=A0A3P3VRG5_9GAMM|nr:LysE family translocator [Aestuariirhabdus litorea]RRJ84276.1 LysE family translocator [Aestuariirhabdus litorea]RWW97498.1 LysE family translocator [Endozoicomonadaceae bacterium GTF-13]
MDGVVLGGYLLGLAVVYLLPGPDMVLLLSTSASGAVGAARAMALGFALARACHALFAAVGVSALLAASPLAFDLLRYLGAAYLLLLAWHSFRSGGLVGAGADPAAGFRKGLMTNLLNPKAVLFCGVFLPQFIDPAGAALWQQFLLLGVLLVAAGLIFDLFYIACSQRLLARLRGRGDGRGFFRWLGSSLLTVLAMRLLLLDGL